MSELVRGCCPKCKQKILQSLSTRCMYCGAELPTDLHPSDAAREAILARQKASNKMHDLAMSAKDQKKKKGPPTAPHEISAGY